MKLTIYFFQVSFPLSVSHLRFLNFLLSFFLIICPFRSYLFFFFHTYPFLSFQSLQQYYASPPLFFYPPPIKIVLVFSEIQSTSTISYTFFLSLSSIDINFSFAFFLFFVCGCCLILIQSIVFVTGRGALYNKGATLLPSPLSPFPFPLPTFSSAAWQHDESVSSASLVGIWSFDEASTRDLLSQVCPLQNERYYPFWRISDSGSIARERKANAFKVDMPFVCFIPLLVLESWVSIIKATIQLDHSWEVSLPSCLLLGGSCPWECWEEDCYLCLFSLPFVFFSSPFLSPYYSFHSPSS